MHSVPSVMLNFSPAKENKTQKPSSLIYANCNFKGSAAPSPKIHDELIRAGKKKKLIETKSMGDF